MGRLLRLYTIQEVQSNSIRLGSKSEKMLRSVGTKEAQNIQAHQTYVSWVNSQLRKRKGCQPIKDLKLDLQDGTVLADLIEIVSGEHLKEILRSVATVNDMYHNIEIILEFMRSYGIRLHHINEIDLVNGNPKTIMRLISALASHFKPSSIRKREIPEQDTSTDTDSNLSFNSVLAKLNNESRTAWEVNGSAVTIPAISGTDFRSASKDQFSSSSLSNKSSPVLSSTENTPRAKTPREDRVEDVALFNTKFELDECCEEIASTHVLASHLQHLLLHGSLPQDNCIDNDISGFRCSDFSDTSPLPQNTNKIKALQSHFDVHNLQCENKKLKAEVLNLRQKYHAAVSAKDTYHLRVKELERQVKQYEQKKSPLKTNNGRHPPASEDPAVGDLLHSLRSSFPRHDPKQHVIDTLEEVISSISEQSRCRVKDRYLETINKKENVRSLNNNNSSHYSSPVNHKKEQKFTRVIYYRPNHTAPTHATIPKPIGTITLEDFKTVVSHSSRYTYSFKALDPEFGTVKKELALDQDEVPGWEGKIVAWLDQKEKMI